MSSHQVIEFARGPAAEGEALKIRRPLAGRMACSGLFLLRSTSNLKEGPMALPSAAGPFSVKLQATKCSIWNHAFCLHRITNNVAFANKSALTFFIFSSSTDTECMVSNAFCFHRTLTLAASRPTQFLFLRWERWVCATQPKIALKWISNLFFNDFSIIFIRILHYFALLSSP